MRWRPAITSSARTLTDGRRGLFRAADAARDQSYFLYATTQEQLDMLRFPLGGIDKAQTRALAAELGLAIADKPDSQDICFVPNGRYADVIERLKPGAARPGEIVHLDGRVLGRHDGVLRYTVGQRKGLGLSTPEPLYVLRLDADSARVVVGPREALSVREIRLRDLNWLGETALDALPDRRHRRRGAGALDAPPARGAADPRRGRAQDRARRRRGGRFARPGLRDLRRCRPRRARARRRHHPAPAAGHAGIRACPGPRRLALTGARRPSPFATSRSMPVTYDLDSQKRAYAGWARIYDKVYQRMLARAQREAVAAACACGPDILEIGVGTGLTLPYFTPSSRVLGADLSLDMLKMASRKVASQKLAHVRGLMVMDACRLGFEAERFDAVTAQFVITLVPDPEQALAEMDRVLKPGGEIIVASRLVGDGGLSASALERACPARQGDRLELRLQGQPPDRLGRRDRPLRDRPCRPGLLQGRAAAQAGLRRDVTPAKV